MRTTIRRIGPVRTQVEQTGDGWLGKLLCPACDGDYVHFDLAHVEATDDYTCPLGTRGSWIALACWCEHCPQKWRLVVGFHKGYTFMGNVT